MLVYEQEFLKVVTDLWGANKTITNPGLRRELGKLLTQSAPRLTSNGNPRAGAVDLARDGFYFLDSNKFDIPGARKALDQFKVFKGVIADHGETPDFATDYTIAERPADAFIVRYHLEDIIRCKPLLDIAANPEIVSIVEGYIGCTPTIASYQVWWTFPGDAVLGPEIFHRDRDDFNFVKLFLYLNDVSVDAGPHEFIQYSHNPVALDAFLKSRGVQPDMNRLFNTNPRKIPIEEMRSTFGDAIRSFAGNAGTMFLEDTFGFHRGTRPTKAPRLIFSVSYTGIPLRFATESDRKEEMHRKLSFADAGMDNPTELQKYLLRYFLN